MTFASASCAQCGARLPAGAVRCDLCGTPVGAPADDLATPADPMAPDASSDSPAASASGKRVFCNQCGHANPAGSRFCSQCGARLEQSEGAAAPAAKAHPASPPPAATAAEAPGVDKALGTQVGLIVGIGLIIVVALYFVTSISRGGLPEMEPAETPPATASVEDSRSAIEIHSDLPLPEQIIGEVEVLEAEIAAASGAARLDKQQELVTLLIGAGRPDRAAIIQQAVAQEVDTPQAWERAGNLFYDWMDQITGQHQAEVALLAIQAYQRVLEDQPDNLDVRATMAVAYLYDPSNPMRAIEETNAVLGVDPDHVQANFNRGLMLMQINRFEQALQQFERVIDLTDETTPIHQQAIQLAESLRETQQG